MVNKKRLIANTLNETVVIILFLLINMKKLKIKAIIKNAKTIASIF